MSFSAQIAPNRRYQFRDFVLDTGARQLLHVGEPIPLTAKEFETLLALVECAGQAVEREALIRRVWPDSFVGDGSLAKNISIVRKYLGPEAIQTVPKHGYRFALPVSTIPGVNQSEHAPSAERRSANAADTASVASDQSTIRAPNRSRNMWLGGLGLLACLALSWIWASSGKVATGKVNAKPSGPVRIAVLPFQTVAGSPANDYLSDGIVGELITELGQANRDHLRVLAKGSSSRYRDTDKNPSQIAQELRVQYLVTGTISQLDRQIEVNVSLVSGSDQSVVWAGKYARPQGQQSEIQAEITDSVAREVQVTLLPDSAPIWRVGETSNPLAHDAYLHGRIDLERKHKDSGQRALEEFQTAVRQDPKYALAYAGLSELYINFANNTPTGPAYAYAKEASITAIRIDDRVAEAHRDLAWILDNNEFDWTGADREYRRALELNPSDARAHHWYAQYLVAQGKPDDALREAQAGLDLDPLSESSNYNYGFILIQDGRLDAAIEHLERELQREPNSEVVLGYLGIAYNRKREYEKAAISFQRAADLSGLHRQYEAGVAANLFLAGQAGNAKKIAGQLRQQYDHGAWIPAVNLSFMYFAFGQKDEGYRFLRRALQEHSCTLLEINTEPILLALRGDPQFEALRTEFHMPDAAPSGVSHPTNTTSNEPTEAQVRR